MGGCAYVGNAVQTSNTATAKDTKMEVLSCMQPCIVLPDMTMQLSIRVLSAFIVVCHHSMCQPLCYMSEASTPLYKPQQGPSVSSAVQQPDPTPIGSAAPCISVRSTTCTTYAVMLLPQATYIYSLCRVQLTIQQ